MKNIILDSGLEVSITGFSMLKTYGGLLTAFPAEWLNRKIYERITCPKDWKATKILKIEPSEEDFKSELKPCYFSVRLESKRPINPNYDASELVVVWLDDFPISETIEQIISEKIANIDWNENACDYQY